MKMKTLFKLVCISVLLVSPAAWSAEQAFLCSFEKECIGTDGCGETSFAFSIEKLDGASTVTNDALFSTSPTHNIITDAETLKAHSFTSKDKTVAGFWLPRSNGDFQSLTIAEDGTARYSVHMPTSELAIFYRGSCKAPS